MDLDNLVSVPVSVSFEDTVNKLQILGFTLDTDEQNIKIYKKDKIVVTCLNDDNTCWTLCDDTKFIFSNGTGRDVIEYVVYSMMYL